MDDTGPEPIPGWRFEGGGVPTRTYRRGRECAEPGCDTRLSVYNAGHYCAQHEIGTRSRVRGRRRL